MPNSQKKTPAPLNKIYFIIFIFVTIIILLIGIISVVDDYWYYYADLNQYDQYLQNKYKQQDTLSQQINRYDPVKGDENAKVTIYLYTDFINPQTAEAVRVLNQLETLYNNQLKFVFKGLPLINHVNNRPSLNSAYCAGEQNAFWQYLDLMILQDNPSYLITSTFQNLAAQLNLNQEIFDQCLTASRYDALFDIYLEQAQYLKINTVPTIYINNEKFEGEINLNNLKTLIDQQL